MLNNRARTHIETGNPSTAKQVANTTAPQAIGLTRNNIGLTTQNAGGPGGRFQANLTNNRIQQRLQNFAQQQARLDSGNTTQQQTRRAAQPRLNPAIREKQIDFTEPVQVPYKQITLEHQNKLIYEHEERRYDEIADGLNLDFELPNVVQNDHQQQHPSQELPSTSPPSDISNDLQLDFDLDGLDFNF
eukprot:UN01307